MKVPLNPIQRRNWYDDGKGLVRIAPCGAKTSGRIEQSLDKVPNALGTDDNNPDPHLHNSPIVGPQMLSSVTYEETVWSGGHAYAPKSGHSCHATLQFNPNGSLRPNGCALFICQSRPGPAPARR
jgi:uncharacterized protein (DUF2147 family)